VNILGCSEPFDKWQIESELRKWRFPFENWLFEGVSSISIGDDVYRKAIPNLFKEATINIEYNIIE
jgi:hypothetical protein